MTPTFKEAKARLDSIPPEAREAYMRKVWAYKHELELAGLPWSALTFLVYVLGAGLILIAGKAPDHRLPILFCGIAVALSSFALQRMAAKKRLAYAQAHPFED